MNLKGATVVVTGGARGLGRKIAETFAAQGAAIALVDIIDDVLAATASEMTAGGARVLPLAIDVTSESQVTAMAERVRKELGAIDVLVNNAGTFSVIAKVWESDADKWFRDIRVGVFGTYLCSRACVTDMIDRKRGYIINMISSAGAIPHPYCTSYSCAKAGVIRFTEDLSIELQDTGVKVFGLMPGAVLTDMTRFIMDDPGGRKYRPNFPEIFSKRRDVSPETVARTALDLVSGRADALSGRNFWAEVGVDETMRESEEILRDDLLLVRFRKPQSLLSSESRRPR